MNWLLTTVISSISAFVATNLDDILVLMLFFRQVDDQFRRRHIVTGQYLGFLVIILASLPGFFGGRLLPQPWIGLLGMVPIAIGLYQLCRPDHEEKKTQIISVTEQTQALSPKLSLSSLLGAKTYGVAAVTFANGGDNIGIYVPLFASNNLASLGIILALFFIMVGVWCYIALRLAQFPGIAHFLVRYGDALIPFVFIGLGIFILLENDSFSLVGLRSPF
ncbi:MAG: cadmium resistance transporter [Scytolyngbya sp. HA4215-MV1]|jgi:cadmium resistance transport/sequestration family protein|nr:cadmium resistance transporter [Scytolyngbya sp. HA4215-MV1]